MTSTSSRTVAATLVALAEPRSIIDLGSDESWRQTFQDAGVDDVVTVEHDFRLPFHADRKFDLAVCIGGAAELPASTAQTLVTSLCEAAHAVAFASPIPGLAAPGAPNPRWPAWWDSLFELHGLVPHDVRPTLWDDTRVDLFLRQALTVYAPAGRFPDAVLPPRATRSVVHPEVHHLAIAQAEVRREREVARLNAALLDADIDAGGLRVLAWELQAELELRKGPRPDDIPKETPSNGPSENGPVDWRRRSFEIEERAALSEAARIAEQQHLRSCREQLAGHRLRSRSASVFLTRVASQSLPIRRRLASLLGTPAPLFDEEYYQYRYPDVALSRTSALWHYRRNGSRDQRSPHRLFDVRWYFERNPDVAAAGDDAVVHYLAHGWKEGRDPHPLFDGAWYNSAHDLGRWNRSPLEHYLAHGRSSDHSPHPLFDPAWYRETNGEVVPPRSDAFAHFDERGWMEGRDPHPLFDVRWYLARNPDAVHAGVNPLEHYLRVGWRSGRDPNPMFDVVYYRQVNAGVLAVDEEPLGHYVRHGAAAGLSTSRLFDAGWYVKNYPDAATARNPLVYFLKVGAARGHVGAPEDDDNRSVHA